MDEPKASLVRDVKLRLASLRKPCPSPAQQAGWGGWRIPWWLTLVAFLLATGGMMYSDRISLSQALGSSDWLWGGALLLAALFMVSTRINRGLAVSAYARRLDHDERFLLLEYDAYLGREITRAGKDPALGGPAEIDRLQRVRLRLQGLLQSSHGDGMLASALAQEIVATQRILNVLADADTSAGLNAPMPNRTARSEAEPEATPDANPPRMQKER